MVQGTASGVGKSVLVTALCRIFLRAGYRVAPFKAQNMSLNAAVTPDGGEIGRAQAAQAEAAGVEPTVDMNPILLKPERDDRSQVVVRGVAQGSLSFSEYARLKPRLLPIVEESLRQLRLAHDLVIIEGAGSPAEINLGDDFVNMGVARMADAPVLLVGDIDRGGLFAALVGTIELLDRADQSRVRGFIINKLRGDGSLLAPGIDFLFARTGVPVLGTLPYLDGPLPAAEDSLGLDEGGSARKAALVEIAVVRFPRISNFDEFEPLAAEPGVRVRFVREPADLEGADLIILPGTKATMLDLEWLRRTGFVDAIAARARAGDPVIGICGGYQMLGATLYDPHHVESPTTIAIGLGLLPVTTAFLPAKRTVRVTAVVAGTGVLARAAGQSVSGYEIHMGQSALDRLCRRPLMITTRQGVAVEDVDGAVSAAGNVLGTYIHGLFENRTLRRALLEELACRKGVRSEPRWGSGPNRSEQYDRLARLVASAVDLPAIAKLVGLEYPRGS